MLKALCTSLILGGFSGQEAGPDLTAASVVWDGGGVSECERQAVRVLVEEVQKRTGLRWPVSEQWREGVPLVCIARSSAQTLAGRSIPERLRTTKAEGYGIASLNDGGRAVVWIVGADERGVLFGVGRLLRTLDWAPGRAALAHPLDDVTAPKYPLRGHQLGYRPTANTYDAWDVAQYEQYIRDLAVFGSNAVENIPLQDQTCPLMKIGRDEMNRAVADICRRYGIEHWAWLPVDVDLSDAEKAREHKEKTQKAITGMSRLDALFVPGGDPGSNPPSLLLPYLGELAEVLVKSHPGAKIWLSLQGFSPEQAAEAYEWIRRLRPAWFGGLVHGPSSPPLEEQRRNVPAQYPIRHYPDITHTIRAQYPVPWWDPAFAYTLGREPVNPQPLYYRIIHNAFAPWTCGFLTYSDGAHDDVNKVVWSALGWNPEADIRGILIEYCRFFFRPDLAERAADGIFALERNWEGPLATNGAVDATLEYWRALEREAPELTAGNWRWQMLLLRAYYDAYTRHRLIYESALEAEVNAILRECEARGSEAAIQEALAVLKRADERRVKPHLRQRIFELCDDLFRIIGFQTSVPKYQARGPERGAVLDYVDYPLNNRLWLEEEFAKVRRMNDETARRARLLEIANWETPGEGCFYDEVGNVAKSPHVIRGEGLNTDPLMLRNPNPDFMWWESGWAKVRQSWMSKMDWPLGLRYTALDPQARYVVRTTGYKDCLISANGVRLKVVVDGREIGQIKEFPVPPGIYPDGVITLTFETPHEPGVNWRYQSRLCEVWLIKK